MGGLYLNVFKKDYWLALLFIFSLVYNINRWLFSETRMCRFLKSKIIYKEWVASNKEKVFLTNRSAPYHCISKHNAKQPYFWYIFIMSYHLVAVSSDIDSLSLKYMINWKVYTFNLNERIFISRKWVTQYLSAFRKLPPHSAIVNYIFIMLYWIF